jgi:ABC-type multidrug transport system fused ATPase/permease subunit
MGSYALVSVFMRVLMFVLMLVLMFVLMLVFMFVLMLVFMFVLMLMSVLVFVLVFMAVRVPEMDLKFHALDLAAPGPLGMDMPAVQGKFGQFLLNAAEIHAQIEHGPQEHVPAEAAENIEIECFQSFNLAAGEASSLI